MWSGVLYTIIPFLVLSASAIPSEAFRRLPPTVQYDIIHKYIQLHWQTEKYGEHDVPEGLKGQFSMNSKGEPSFGDEVQEAIFAACTVALHIPKPKQQDTPSPNEPDGSPYKTEDQRKRMEICVLYALDLLDVQGVAAAAAVPLERVVEAYGLTRGKEDSEPETPPAPSQFSLERFHNIGRYFRREGRPGAPAFKRPFMRPVY